jgi:excinuclease ABC subunit C
MIPDYKNIVSSLPSKPGVYQFLDESGKIIYVGKAKNLRNRVGSYFSGTQPPKTTVMLKKAVGIRHIVVDNESDALLLENNIIKEQQPRDNILLKDDKTFPWICIKKEPFPRVFSTRNTFRDGSVYFGPYTSGLMVKTLLNTIKQIYKLRSCSLKLTSENIKSGKFKPCLEYHIGNCKAPCIGLQDEFDYEENINQIEGILKGNISSVIEHLKDLMMKYSSETRFEEAQIIKEKIEILSKYKSRSNIVNPKIKNVDVFGFTADSSRTYVSFMKVVNGAVIQAYTLDLKHRVDEEEKSLLSYAITEIKQRLSNDSPEIIVPFKPDILFEIY